jgi:EAL domain-containing protein (putative c-di-GMP-specific phosphodiesterase class I)
LCFEITESLLIDDLDAAATWLRDIEAMGIRIALDDFGTGYSALAYLVRLPVNCIKIDRGFTSQLDTDREQAAVAAAIFQMAQALGLGVVAEGVETREQLSALRAMGRCEIQGWMIGKAMPEADFERFLGCYPEAVAEA